jgi:predicted RNA binding protein YcfA (HicA-like mRNA interferase family)
MKQVSGKALIKIAAERGWVIDRIKGSHHVMIKEGESSILTIPIHSNKPLRIGLLKALMKQAGLTDGDL